MHIFIKGGLVRKRQICLNLQCVSSQRSRRVPGLSEDGQRINDETNIRPYRVTQLI